MNDPSLPVRDTSRGIDAQPSMDEPVWLKPDYHNQSMMRLTLPFSKIITVSLP